MGNDAELRRKLSILSFRVTGRYPGNYDVEQIETRVKGLSRPDNEAIRESVGKTFGVSREYVDSRLASHDDSNRLIDEILNELGGKSGR